MPDRYLMAMTTTDVRSDAERLARDLVERRLAACVQVLGPISSTYRWRGSIETADEWLCLIKTTAATGDDRLIPPPPDRGVRSGPGHRAG